MDTRDLSLFQEVSFWVRNDTGAPFTLVFEVKDYRDSNAHRARREYVLSAAPVWTEVRAPLDLGQPGWQVDGAPDLTRAKVLTFVIEADQGAAVSGSIHVDDMALIESGGPLVSNAPLDALVERLARRQFLGLWGARDRTTGMMPAISSYADLCAVNVLAAVIKMLPVAVQRSWVSAAEADAFVAQAVATLGGVMDGTEHVPPRYLDRVALTPAAGDEESSVDAAMLFLALYQYKSVPATPPSL